MKRLWQLRAASTDCTSSARSSGGNRNGLGRSDPSTSLKEGPDYLPPVHCPAEERPHSCSDLKLPPGGVRKSSELLVDSAASSRRRSVVGAPPIRVVLENHDVAHRRDLVSLQFDENSNFIGAVRAKCGGRDLPDSIPQTASLEVVASPAVMGDKLQPKDGAASKSVDGSSLNDHQLSDAERQDGILADYPPAISVDWDALSPRCCVILFCVHCDGNPPCPSSERKAITQVASLKSPASSFDSVSSEQEDDVAVVPAAVTIVTNDPYMSPQVVANLVLAPRVSAVRNTLSSQCGGSDGRGCGSPKALPSSGSGPLWGLATAAEEAEGREITSAARSLGNAWFFASFVKTSEARWAFRLVKVYETGETESLLLAAAQKLARQSANDVLLFVGMSAGCGGAGLTAEKVSGGCVPSSPTSSSSAAVAAAIAAGLADQSLPHHRDAAGPANGILRKEGMIGEFAYLSDLIYKSAMRKVIHKIRKSGGTSEPVSPFSELTFSSRNSISSPRMASSPLAVEPQRRGSDLARQFAAFSLTQAAVQCPAGTPPCALAATEIGLSAVAAACPTVPLAPAAAAPAWLPPSETRQAPVACGGTALFVPSSTPAAEGPSSPVGSPASSPVGCVGDLSTAVISLPPVATPVSQTSSSLVTSASVCPTDASHTDHRSLLAPQKSDSNHRMEEEISRRLDRIELEQRKIACEVEKMNEKLCMLLRVMSPTSSGRPAPTRWPPVSSVCLPPPATGVPPRSQSCEADSIH